MQINPTMRYRFLISQIDKVSEKKTIILNGEERAVNRCLKDCKGTFFLESHLMTQQE